MTLSLSPLSWQCAFDALNAQRRGVIAEQTKKRIHNPPIIALRIIGNVILCLHVTASYRNHLEAQNQLLELP